MSRAGIIVSLSILFLANVGLLLTLAWLLRRKHRYLFGLITQHQREHGMDQGLLRLRREVRSLDFAVRHPDHRGSSTVSFRAQFGEDTFLYDYFEGRDHGFFIEAGAYDGETFSNTYAFEGMGWRGLLVEAHPGLAETCRQKRPDSTVVHAALGGPDAEGDITFTCADATDRPGPLSFAVATQAHIERCRREGYALKQVSVPCRPLNSLLDGLTENVDLLSIDVEGMELEVLRGFDIKKYQPDVILVESSDAEEKRAIAEYLTGFGFRADFKRGPNTFYIKADAPKRIADGVSRMTP